MPDDNTTEHTETHDTPTGRETTTTTHSGDSDGNTQTTEVTQTTTKEQTS